MLVAQKGQTAYEVSEVYDDETGVLRMRQIRLNGMLHAPSDAIPSHSAFDKYGRPLLFEWHHQDLGHRENGPSQIHLNPENQVHVMEIFERFGQAEQNDLGAHVVHRSKATGEVTYLIDQSGEPMPLPKGFSSPEP